MFRICGRAGLVTGGVVIVLLAVCTPTSAGAQMGLPDVFLSGPLPGRLDRLGVSPRNLFVDPSVRYEYVFVLRDNHGMPIPGFPASQIVLDFSGCEHPSTRPLDEIPADHASNQNGEIVWRTNLSFGGADPCAVDVRVLNVLFHTIPAADPGGVRSPDLNGDGLIALVDLVQWAQCFVAGGPPGCCDLAMPFDDICSLEDLRWVQRHFTAQ